MRKIIISLAVVLLVLTSVSAEIIVTNQPKELYNIGDTLNSNIKINAIQNTEGFFSINLLCPGKETEVHKEYISLSQGEEEKISTKIPLDKELIGPSTGTCKLKSILNEEFVLSNDFSISNLINVKLKEQEKNFEPEKEILIEGEAKKENGENVQGFINVGIRHKETSEGFNITDTVNNGFFQITQTLPEKTKAGEYFIEIKVYEKGPAGEITNEGYTESSLSVSQIPNNLEIVIENEKIIPGKEIKIKAILRDQTGEKIPSDSIITIKDSSNRIKTQETVKTDEFFEFPVEYNEPANKWKVVAISNKISSEKEIEIIENEEIEIEIINRTVIIKNKGNIPYNETVFIKIGNQTKSIETYLEVDESKKYTLSAPEGEYDVKIESNGEEKLSKKVLLTGKAIGIKETSEGLNKIARDPISWILMIFVLLIIFFLIIRKRKKNFFGTIPSNIDKKEKKSKKDKTKTEEINRKNSLVPNTENIANLSLSMKGEHNHADIICLKINNIEEIKSNTQGIKETMEKIKKDAEKLKAYIYESQNSIFFIFSPRATKTFDNEKNIINLSQKIKSLLEHHNKMFKQKIDYGISISRGKIISKFDKDSKTMSFMPLGNLMNVLKKIGKKSKGEILIGKEFKNKAGTLIKTEKHESEEIECYRITEIKNHEDHSKFIKSFLKRQEESSK